MPGYRRCADVCPRYGWEPAAAMPSWPRCANMVGTAPCAEIVMGALARKTLICDVPPDAVISAPFDGLLQPENQIIGGRPTLLAPVGGRSRAYRLWLPATEPWIKLHYPDGKPIICYGIRIQAMELDWAPSLDGPPITTLCPNGTRPAGPGWTFRFCPPYAVSVAINGVQCSAPNPHHNPRDVFSRVGAGPVSVGFNDRAPVRCYLDNAGGCHLVVLAVYL